MNLTSLVTFFLCLLQICHSRHKRQNDHVHNQFLWNSESGIAPRALGEVNSLGQKVESKYLNTLKTEVKRSNNYESPMNDIQGTLENNHIKIKFINEPDNKQGKEGVGVSGVLEHLLKETKFLRKKNTEVGKETNHDAQTEEKDKKIDDDSNTLDEEGNAAESPMSELRKASHLNREEEVEIQQLKDLHSTNQNQKRELTPRYKEEKLIKLHQLGEPRLKRKKRDTKSHGLSISAFDFLNFLKNIPISKKYQHKQLDKTISPVVLQKVGADYSDYTKQIRSPLHKKTPNNIQRLFNEDYIKKRGTTDDDEEEEGNDDNGNDEDESDEEDEDESDEDDNDKINEKDFDNDEKSNSKVSGTKDGKQSNPSTIQEKTKEDDMNSLTDLSSETQFLHKERPNFSSIMTKNQRKSKSRTIDWPIERLKAALHYLSIVTRKRTDDVKIPEDEMNDSLNKPKTSKMLEAYQEPYVPPANAETSIVASAVLWIGVAVGTAFSAIMFILCCSFYKCLFYYRTHLSSPLRSFLESYDNKEKSDSKLASRQTDGDNQYVISIGDKNQDDLVWSSGEEEVFDVSSVKQSRDSSVKKSPETN